jgi:hypothetical protein
MRRAAHRGGAPVATHLPVGGQYVHPRRLWLAAEARSLGYGGTALVAAVTKVAKDTISDGIKELAGQAPPAGRVRRAGAAGPGRAASAPSRWSLQANSKTLEGSWHADRDAQFHHINAAVKAALAAGEPVISVDTKKKELVGPYKNGGREYRPRGEPEQVNVHDFIDRQLGKAVPYGVCDVGANTGWMNVGVDHDTAAFAVNSIRTWWNSAGKDTYPGAAQLLITADCGGSNGNRVRLWKTELAALAAETGLTIKVCHHPPGTRREPPNGPGSSTSCSASSR